MQYSDFGIEFIPHSEFGIPNSEHTPCRGITYPDRWMPEINGAQINVLWPPLDGIQVRITACVGAEDLALHTYPAPPSEG